MQMRIAALSLLSVFSVAPSILTAHPVSYQGAISLMAWNQPYMTDWWATYSLRPNFAVAARAMRMDMKEAGK
jgi:hypothetical protein